MADVLPAPITTPTPLPHERFVGLSPEQCETLIRDDIRLLLQKLQLSGDISASDLSAVLNKNEKLKKKAMLIVEDVRRELAEQLKADAMIAEKKFFEMAREEAKWL